MDIKIVKLTQGMGETFTNYFDSLDFGHEPHWAGCYCRFYHNDDSVDWKLRRAEDNRPEAVAEINNGNMKGFLAFEGDKCIGWLNANNSESYMRLKEDVELVVKDKKVGIVICFVIHPDFRGMGVATKLLNAAVSDFEEQNYDAVLAMPIYSETFSPKMYRGTVSMYQKAGFEKINEFGDVHVYWRKL